VRPVRAIPPEAAAAILAWFDAGGRSFPFRGVGDPYAILVSETMAQQTQIARATEKWGTFMALFPTVEALAAAAPADVLREWRGLGYNRRALNLWRAARAIVAEHGGQVPDDLAALERLPGIGPYTARAVAALAFGRPVGAVDTNVRRVLGRIVGGAEAPPARELQAIADASVPTNRPGDWTHALMDVGATICKPARPDCVACPAVRWCRFAEAAPAAPVRAGTRRASEPVFRSTSRWLRGRLLDRLRDAGDQAWIAVAPPVGDHDGAAVDRALAALERDGLIERHPTDPSLARLPLA
jgi:A/G-specific adenine glycosylase